MGNKRILIYSGGTLGRWALEHIREDDMIIGADRGALFLIQHGITPHLALGDFDSVNHTEKDFIRKNSLQFKEVDPVNKNYTDTELAFNWALEQNPAEIILLGALGSRFDHTLANIHLLRKGLQHAMPCKIIDAHNEVILINGPHEIAKQGFAHCSLLPLSMEVTGITLTGFQYPLHNATLTIGQSLGISNVITEQKGSIQLEQGDLLVILSKDESSSIV